MSHWSDLDLRSISLVSSQSVFMTWS